MVVVLDSGILSELVHKDSERRHLISNFLASKAYEFVVIPEIADYEVRRSLKRISSSNSLRMLDELVSIVEYVPIATSHMHRAADIWAESRKRGKPFANDKNIDGDAILIAQVEQYMPNMEVLTTNASDIGTYLPAVLVPGVR